MNTIIDSKNDLCVGCNRCVRECPMEMANNTFQDNEGNIKVKIDHDKCINCGRCISACKHEARYYCDDTELFFSDLQSGVPITLIAAPSISTNIPEYKKLFTYLKQLGVKNIFDVSLGADICIWGHVRHIGEYPDERIITQPCPVIVSYCEMYRHDLLKWLSPIHGPMACLSIYIKKYLGIKDRIAAISPCIAKSIEFRDTELSSYNITFEKLLEHIKAKNIKLPDSETGFDNDESGLGSLFPLPGGLKENIDYFTGSKLYVVKAEGFNVYEKLCEYADMPDDVLPDIFDVLNCEEGCNIGPASTHDKSVFYIDKKMNDTRKKALEEKRKKHYESVYKKYDKAFDISHFKRVYKPVDTYFPVIAETDIEAAYEMLGKNNYEQQNVDCSACGSKTCHDMARKIALSVNIPINCIVKSMEEARTERKNYLAAHNQLLYAVEIAQEASRAKTEFLASMSHEIRTPMNAIIGMSEILEHENLNERQAGYIKDIRISADSLLGIINDILDMSKIEAGKLELRPVDYNFKQFIDNIISIFTHVSQNKGLEFIYTTEGEMPDCLFGDDIRLRQVLTNVCGNAVKFTEKGFVKMTISTDVGKLIFTIEDTGMGIRAEDMSRLFNAFEQLDEEKNRSIVGTGLGLPICKSIVEMMGGDIIAKSEYGRGAAFTVTIPIVIGNEENIRSGDAEKTELSIIAPDARILITDDNEFNLKVTCGLLNFMEINAETADSGFKAIELIKKNDYDIVFMDHMMPEMDGIETVHRIRDLGGKYEDLKIIALTANAIKGAREMFIKNSFDDFLSKPIDVDEMRKIIKRYLPQEKVKVDENGEKKQFILKKEEELFRKSIVTFVKDNKDTFKKMIKALTSSDISTAHRIAHTVKSAAGYLGRRELQEAAASLETSLRDDTAGHKPEQLRIFEEELSSALADFEQIILKTKEDKLKAVQLSDEELTQMLKEIEPLLRKNDFSALGYVERLRDTTDLEELADLIDDYDFAGALELLEKVISK